MKDNGRQMQIIQPGENVETLTAGTASSILSDKENIYVRVFADTDGTKCSIATTPSEANAHTLVTGETFYIVPKDYKIAVYVNDAELMY